MLPYLSLETKSQAFDRCLNSEPREIIFETLTGSIHILKQWQCLSIVIKRLNGKNLWFLSISTPAYTPLLPFPPKGPKPIPSLTMSSSLTPTNTSEGTPTHFFPSHVENNKQLPDKQRKMEFFLGDCQKITIHIGQ